VKQKKQPKTQLKKQFYVSEFGDQSEVEEDQSEVEEDSERSEELQEENKQSDPEEESNVEDLQEENEERDVFVDNSDYFKNITPEEKKAAIQYYLSFPEMERLNISAQFNETPEFKRSRVWRI